MPTDNRRTAHKYNSQSTAWSNNNLTEAAKPARIHTYLNGSYTGATNAPKVY